MTIAKRFAARHRITLGEAVSYLVTRGGERPMMTAKRNGFHVVRLDRGPRVTSAKVARLLDEVP